MTVDQYAAHLICEGLADNTVRVYRCMLQRWIDWAIANGRDPNAPEPLGVRAWANTIPATPSARHQARAALKHWCRLLDVSDPAGAIRVPRQPRVLRSRALTDDQVRQLLRTAETAGLAGLAVIVGLFTGARRSEIASLAWDRIDLKARILTLDRTKVDDTHDVVICEYLARHLELRHSGTERWVFPGRHGGHTAPAVIWEMVRDVATQAGIGKITTHSLRHTAISAVYEAGRDPYAAQQIAGHVDPKQTARYARRTDSQILAALDQATARWLDDTEDDEAA